MTNASVKPALERIQTYIAEIKDLIQNGKGKQNHEESEQKTEPVDCLCDETKKELKPNAE